ncbi:hypothetical protein BDV96DRAFT_34070 [Lophiotrema nucula]|uniref:Uncharacterized protein n=1 Tax=Lophiotrema nucula TaxID=690887 RepID=A0A6A5ZB81_9PLEO|nr:hypothetical protein BDV96DRAFT_34070 [Lophiotrema nucula]
MIFVRPAMMAPWAGRQSFAGTASSCFQRPGHRRLKTWPPPPAPIVGGAAQGRGVRSRCWPVLHHESQHHGWGLVGSRIRSPRSSKEKSWDGWGKAWWFSKTSRRSVSRLSCAGPRCDKGPRRANQAGLQSIRRLRSRRLAAICLAATALHDLGLRWRG